MITVDACSYGGRADWRRTLPQASLSGDPILAVAVDGSTIVPTLTESLKNATLTLKGAATDPDGTISQDASSRVRMTPLPRRMLGHGLLIAAAYESSAAQSCHRLQPRPSPCRTRHRGHESSRPGCSEVQRICCTSGALLRALILRLHPPAPRRLVTR